MYHQTDHFLAQMSPYVETQLYLGALERNRDRRTATRDRARTIIMWAGLVIAAVTICSLLLMGAYVPSTRVLVCLLCLATVLLIFTLRGSESTIDQQLQAHYEEQRLSLDSGLRDSLMRYLEELDQESTRKPSRHRQPAIGRALLLRLIAHSDQPLSDMELFQLRQALGYADERGLSPLPAA